MSDVNRGPICFGELLLDAGLVCGFQMFAWTAACGQPAVTHFDHGDDHCILACVQHEADGRGGSIGEHPAVPLCALHDASWAECSQDSVGLQAENGDSSRE